jgi:hypothetical protein
MALVAKGRSYRLIRREVSLSKNTVADIVKRCLTNVGNTPPSVRRDKGIAVEVEIVFETHSLTVDNDNGIATGWLPGRLSARGRALAAQLGRRYRDTELAAVFVSDLHRAVETLQIAFADALTTIHQDERLRECYYGDLNGCPACDLAGLRCRHIDLPFPGGRS